MEDIGWHMDKKVTLALIAALLINAGGTIWWASRLDATVMTHQQRIDTLTVTVTTLGQQQGSTNEKLARIEEGQKYQTDMLKDVRDGLKERPK